MATIRVQFDDSLVKSVTFSGYGKKDHTSSSFTFTSPLAFTDAEVYGSWSGKIYWDPTSSHSDPTLVANVSNGVVSMSPTHTVSVKDRTIYIYGEKSASTPVLQIASTGWPGGIIHSVNLTDGTFSSQNSAINFTRTQRIESLYITGDALSNYWDGKIYWKNENGSKFLIATVNHGSVYMNSNIEPITYSGGSRTISFVAEGQYYHKVEYFKNDGTWNSGSDPYIDYVVDGGYSYTSVPSNNISRNGYRLLGWSTSSTATTASYGVNEAIGPLGGNVKLWAVWIKNTVTITLDANGGVFQDNQETFRSIPNQVIGSQFSFKSYSGLVARSNHRLLGWSADKNATTPTYGTDGYVDVGGSNATYYAIWKRLVDPFQWESESWDASNIKRGQPVKNLTATRWNKLLAKIKEVSELDGGSFSYSTVISGATIYASTFNYARIGILHLTGSGALPVAQETKNEVKALFFEGSGSLKSALNAAIDYYNNS